MVAACNKAKEELQKKADAAVEKAEILKIEIETMEKKIGALEVENEMASARKKKTVKAEALLAANVNRWHCKV